jgi:hypothetical protein
MTMAIGVNRRLALNNMWRLLNLKKSGLIIGPQPEKSHPITGDHDPGCLAVREQATGFR